MCNVNDQYQDAQSAWTAAIERYWGWECSVCLGVFVLFVLSAQFLIFYSSVLKDMPGKIWNLNLWESENICILLTKDSAQNASLCTDYFLFCHTCLIPCDLLQFFLKHFIKDYHSKNCLKGSWSPRNLIKSKITRAESKLVIIILILFLVCCQRVLGVFASSLFFFSVIFSFCSQHGYDTRSVGVHTRPIVKKTTFESG